MVEQLPHNPDAERSLLSCFLQAERAIDEAGDLRPDDFLIPAHRAVFDAIRALRGERKPVDIVTVGDAMARVGTAQMLGGDSLLAISQHVPIWHSVRHYGVLVARDGTQRRLIAACANISARAMRGDDAVEITSDARQLFADLEIRRDGGPVRLGDRLDEVIARIAEKTTAPETYRVNTGISRFDREIGGFRAPQLVVIAARPGIGKTALAGNVVLRAAKAGIPALVFSLEMSFDEMAERFIGADASVSVERIHRGLVSAEETAKLRSRAKALSPVPLFVDDRMLSIGQVTATARSWRLRRQEKQAVIVIDYLGLIRSSGKAENRNLEVGAMARGAKHLAKELDCPVVLVAQLNRAMEKEGREPMLSDLRDSGEIEAHADMVLFPHREPPTDGSGSASLIVAKHRGGVTGKIPCWWHAETMTFEGLKVDEMGATREVM